MNKDRQELNSNIAVYYGNIFIKLEIVINPDEMHDELILTKNYKLRGIVLHDLYDTVFNEGSTFYYRDLIVYMDDGVLVVGIEDDGQGIKWRLNLDAFEWGQLKFMFNRITR